MRQRNATIVASTSLNQDTSDRLDAFCNLTHRNRSEVIRGLLHTLLVDGEQPIFGECRHRGNVGNKDGEDEAAVAFIKEHLDLSGVKLSAMLSEHNIKRGPSWVNLRKAENK